MIVPLTITEMSADVLLDGNVVNISLPSEVDIPAKGSERLKMERSLAEAEVPTEISTQNIRNMKMILDIRGIELEIGESGLGGII